MVQKIFGLGIGATGIVGTLIVAGIILTKMNIGGDTASLAIFGGVVIGLMLGGLGVIGVLKRIIG